MVEGWGEIRTSLTFGIYGSFPGATARWVLAPRLDFINAGSVQDATIGGAQTVVFHGPRGPWALRQAMIVYRDVVYAIVAQPWEPERFPTGIEYLDRVQWSSSTGGSRLAEATAGRLGSGSRRRRAVGHGLD